MHVRLDDITDDEPFTWDTREERTPEQLGRGELVAALSPIHWRGSIQRMEQDLLLRARADYVQTLVCQRSLETYEDPVQATIELLLVPDEAVTAEELELGEDDLGVHLIEGAEIDLDPILDEEIQLNIPMRPIKEGSKSLLEDHAEKATADDPRWAGLAALKERLEQEEEDGAGED